MQRDNVKIGDQWAHVLDPLRESDPDWTERYTRMAVNPWTTGNLSIKELQLISIGLNASIANLDATALRRHIRAALRAGVSRTEIVEVLKIAAVLALHSMSLGAPILTEEAKVVRSSASAEHRSKPATPACDRMRTIGQWNSAWDPFYELDPGWTEEFIAACAGFYTSGVFTPVFLELISIAFDASITHMYAPGTRRHIKAALALGASVGQVTDVLKLCVSQGANALDLAVPILAVELAEYSGKG